MFILQMTVVVTIILNWRRYRCL